MPLQHFFVRLLTVAVSGLVLGGRGAGAALPTNTKIDAGANFRDGAQEKLTSLRIYFICDAENRLEGARSRPYRPERPILCHPSKRLPA